MMISIYQQNKHSFISYEWEQVLDKLTMLLSAMKEAYIHYAEKPHLINTLENFILPDDIASKAMQKKTDVLMLTIDAVDKKVSQLSAENNILNHKLKNLQAELDATNLALQKMQKKSAGQENKSNDALYFFKN